MTDDILHVKVAAGDFATICCPIPTSLFIKDNVTSDADTPCGWVQQSVCLYSILIANEDSGRAAVIELA
jgi:hypothetical protein